MRKTITAIVATVGIAAAALAVPKPAEARCIGCWVGAGVAAAVIGGAVASQAYGGYGYGYPAYSYGYGYPSVRLRLCALRLYVRAATCLCAPLLPLLSSSNVTRRPCPPAGY